MTGARVLFISYDGLTDPLGRSQVLPYLAGLSARGHRIAILSCEKPSARVADGVAVARLCTEAGLDWRPVTYHKHPPILSSAYDTRRLTRRAAALHRSERFDIVHCRSYIPAIAGLALKRRSGVRFLFDMRGFWIDEKIEGGNWRPDSPVFRPVIRHFRNKEAAFFRQADHVISLTDSARINMEERGVEAPMTVIPCCVDFRHFVLADQAKCARARAALGIGEERSVLVYLGSLGGNYMLDEMLDFFRAWRQRRRNALFLFVTRDAEEPIRRAAAARRIGPEALIVRAASRDQVPHYLAAADLGVAFKRPTFSALACSPTKLGEMLAAGLSVVAVSLNGDVAPVLSDTGAGVVVSSFDVASLTAAAEAASAIHLPPEEIRARALRWFDLEEGVARYDSVYRSLMNAHP